MRLPSIHYRDLHTAAGQFLRRWATRCGTAGLNLLLPPRCVCCDADLLANPGKILLCQPCQSALAPVDWRGCPRCGAPVPSDQRIGSRCPFCHTSRLWFDTVVPLGSYHGGLSRVVLRMKGPSQSPLAVAMGQLLAHCRAPQLVDLRADLVVPVPMYWTRRLSRGTNSPDIIAEQLVGCLKGGRASGVLARCRNTLPQKGLPPQKRFHNVRGAFRVRRGYNLQGRRVLLVDDTLTTGATCSEAARVLKRAGAAMVAVAVVARATGADRK